MKKLYIFKRNSVWPEQSKTFTHYWSNEGQNFFDSIIQSESLLGHTVEESSLYFKSSFDPETSKGPTEYYLEEYKNDGYRWVEIPCTRYQRQALSSLKIELTEEEFKTVPVLFFKLVELDEKNEMVGIPQYYFSTNVTEVSDQNFESTSYSVVCELDLWASCWVYFHTFMRDCPLSISFENKMANRFIFQGEEEWKKEHQYGYGFWIDYLKQPYLMRTNEYKSNLVCDNRRENFLTLDDWLFINSDAKDRKITKNQWLEETWIPWIKNQWCAFFSPNNDIYGFGKFTGIWKNDTQTDMEEIGLVEGKVSLQDAYKKINRFATPIRNNDFLDSNYNSNSKYRYLVCKIGNNTWPSSTFKDGQKEIPTYPKQTMFGQEYFYTYTVEPQNTKTLQAGTISDDNWSTDTWHSEFWYDVKILDDYGSITTPKMVSYQNWLINEKSLNILVKYGDYTSKQYFLDGLDKKLNYIYINGVQYDKLYELTKVPAKSIVYNLNGDYTNISIKIGVVFTTSGAYLRFNAIVETSLEVEPEKLNISFGTIPTVVNGILFENVSVGQDVEGLDHKIDGEALVIIPFKKGEDEAKYIAKLNSIDNKIIMGDGSVLGMAVNDIPPSVLAAALRKFNDNNNYQTFGDMMSLREGSYNGSELPKCPLDIVNLSLSSLEKGTGENKKILSNYEAPTIFAQFDSIPVVVATSPTVEGPYDVIGGNNFFNEFYDFLTDNQKTMKNTMDVEPLLYGPAFWKWSYFIDASHKLELTADMIDFKKMLTEPWNVFLNVNMSDKTNYYLDIKEIKNSAYPMSKVGLELITADVSSFPYTTEAYQHWLQNNKWAQETSRELKEVKNKYAERNATINAVTGGIAAPISGAAGGMKYGKSGVIAGAAIGAATGASTALGTIFGTMNAIAQANEEWEIAWKEQLSNLYSSPSLLQGGGFTNGSLVYSPNQEALQSSYELFRTYELPELMKKLVWYDISMKGYKWISQCPYAEYNNRVNFNVVNCNLIDRAYEAIAYMKKRMFEFSPIFAQDSFVVSFIDKCKNLFRVFKVDLTDYQSLDELIEGNIELIREWYVPFYGEALKWTKDLNVHVKESDKDWNTDYEATGKEVIREIPLNEEIEVNYSDFGDYDTFNDIATDYEGIQLSFTGSTIKVSADDKTIYETKNNLIYNNEKSIMFGTEEQFNEATYYNIIDSGNIGHILYAKNQEQQLVSKSSNYELGYKITMTDDADNKKIKFTISSYSKFTFPVEVEGWTFTSDTSELSFDATDRMVKVEDFLFTNGKPHNHSYYNKVYGGFNAKNGDIFTYCQYGMSNLDNLANPRGNEAENVWAVFGIDKHVRGSENENPYKAKFDSAASINVNSIRKDDSAVLFDNLTEYDILNNEIKVDLSDKMIFQYWASSQTNMDTLREEPLNKQKSDMDSPVNWSCNVDVKLDKIPTFDASGNYVLWSTVINKTFTGLKLAKGEHLTYDINDGKVEALYVPTVFLHVEDNKGVKTYSIRYIVQILARGSVINNRYDNYVHVYYTVQDMANYPELIRWISVKEVKDRSCNVKFLPKETKSLKLAYDNALTGITFVRKSNDTTRLSKKEGKA